MAAVERLHLRRLLLGLTVPVVLLSACDEPGPFRRLDIRDQTPHASSAAARLPDVDLGATPLRLVDGIASQASVVAFDDADEQMPALELRSADPNVFDVTRAPGFGRYVFFGASPGSSQLLIRSDGRQVGSVTVTVLPQPAPP